MPLRPATRGIVVVSYVLVAATLLLGLAAMLHELRRGPVDPAALHLQQAEVMRVAATSPQAPA